MNQEKKTEAQRIADEFKLCNEHDCLPSMNDIDSAAAELLRLHAENENLHASCGGMRQDRDRYFTLYGHACEVSARRLNEIANLEAQLSVIGAGGVEALRKRHQDVGSSITIDFKQATELLEMFGGEPAEITLMEGDGHSGNGLYAIYTDMPEEGSGFLGASDNEAMPEAPAQEHATQLAGQGHLGDAVSALQEMWDELAKVDRGELIARPGPSAMRRYNAALTAAEQAMVAIAQGSAISNGFALPLTINAEMAAAWAKAPCPDVDGMNDEEANFAHAQANWSAMLAAAPTQAHKDEQA